MKDKGLFCAVVAHPVAAERKRIRASLERLGYFSSVAVTDNGTECLEILAEGKTDLVILSTVLNGLDGLGVLEQMHNNDSSVKRLVLTEYAGFVERQAAALGADYCLLMPCSYEQIARRASQLLLPPDELLPTDAVIDRETRQILQNLVGATRLKGADDAVVSTRLLIQDWNRIHYITTEVYGEVARRRNAQWKSVDHAIRTLVDRVWTKASLELLESYFSAAYPEWKVVKPTNTVFLASLAQLVSQSVGVSIYDTQEDKRRASR